MEKYIFFINANRFELTAKQLKNSGLCKDRIEHIKKIHKQGGTYVIKSHLKRKEKQS